MNFDIKKYMNESKMTPYSVINEADSSGKALAKEFIANQKEWKTLNAELPRLVKKVPTQAAALDKWTQKIITLAQDLKKNNAEEKRLRKLMDADDHAWDWEWKLGP